MKLKLNLLKIIIWLIFIAVFIYVIYPYSDYDWGWHLQYGRYFINTGQILRDNLYTWTLPNYKWANPSWAYDVFLYLSYIKLGFVGLSVIGAIVGFLIFLISTINSKLNYLLLGGLALFFVKLTEEALFEGIRGQSFGLLFLCLIMFILIKAITKPKALLLIPLLMFIWANLNGTFSLGILILGIFVGSNIIIRLINHFTHKPNTNLIDLKMLIIASFLSICASLVNPFTYKVYYEGLVHITSPWINNVIEWLPADLSCPSCNFGYFLTFQAILIVVFTIRRKLTDLPYIVTLLFLSSQSYLHIRYLSMFMVTSLPIAAMMLSDLKIGLDKYKITQIISTFVLIILIYLGLFIRLPKFNLFNYSFNDYCYNGSGCSPGLADFLIKNPPAGKGLNFYDWGGFFIGRGVKTKLFVDGRTQLWEDHGYSPFGDYIKIYYWQNLGLFNQYKFDWVIVRNDSYLSNALLIPNNSLGNWKRVYYDQQASYFVRVK